MKRLQNIEGKNKEQLDAIKDQGEKQLDVIEKRKENKPKTIEKDKVVYLKDKIDRLFEMYRNSFVEKVELLNTLAKNEKKINYKSLSYEIILRNGKVHEFSFLKKYGTLYSLMEDLVTKKMTVNSADADQISFISNLMHGYDDWDLFYMKTLGSGVFYNRAFTKAKEVFLDTRNQKK